MLASSAFFGTLTITTLAFAFSRNLSGPWKTAAGNMVAIVHNTRTSEAVFSFPNLSSNIPITSIEFMGTVRGEDGSTEFVFDGHAEDVAVRLGHFMCTLAKFGIHAQRQVLRQFPNRSIEMRRCSTTFAAHCVADNGLQEDKIITKDCTGTWR